jgi:TetR/AcrR family transcriptional regulator, ethionamide resistance regulator
VTENGVISRRAQRAERPSKGDLREQALLQAAERLLGAGVFADASVADIAREAQISRASFYFYFASKNALLACVIDTAVQGFNEQIMLTLDPADSRSPAEALAATVAAAGQLWWDHRAVLVASVELGASIPEAYERTKENLAIVAVPTVALLQRHGRVPEASNYESASRLVTALSLMTERSFFDLLRGTPSIAQRNELTELLTTIWLRAFGLDS